MSTEQRQSSRTVRDGGRFTVWWAATILHWDETDRRTVDALVDRAMDLLPRQGGIVGGDYSYDRNSFCFWVYVEAATNTVARSLAIAGLRDALLSAGIGLGPESEWPPLVLDLDPRPLRLRPFEAADILPHLSPQ